MPACNKKKEKKKGKRCEEQKTGRRQRVKVNLERKIGSLNSESNLVISLTTGPAEGQRGRGQVPGVHLPQQKYRHGAWLTGKLENLKWDAHSQWAAHCFRSLVWPWRNKSATHREVGHSWPSHAGPCSSQAGTKQDQAYRRVGTHAAFGKTFKSVFREPPT